MAVALLLHCGIIKSLLLIAIIYLFHCFAPAAAALNKYQGTSLLNAHDLVKKGSVKRRALAHKKKRIINRNLCKQYFGELVRLLYV